MNLTELDAHEQPAEWLKSIWKGFSKTEHGELDKSPLITDPRSPDHLPRLRQTGSITGAQVSKAYSHLDLPSQDRPDVPIYQHPLVPGLLIIPNLLGPEVQQILLSRMIHRDLSNPKHQTNLHLHYDLPYPKDDSSPEATSLFTYPPDSTVRFEPKDPSVHKPLSIKQVMERRLHWVTLGGQYDWTNRVYPSEEPPAFPPDLAGFLESLFPETVAQAAILNFYTPGDTMMLHRDVSEETDKGLISLSMGCDGLFMITPNDIKEPTPKENGADEQSAEDLPYLLLRIRSGDAIYMTQESRYAWHGVPKVLKGSCPDFLADWPAEEDGKYEGWKGWIKNKRINLNVRQMRD
ncbi:hypothetical protein jhhlp_003187 [Lomentospora prolificans]|uniref:mRNA N(6)-methyladenine demethylase n=1 Tax=Lomentospora prolificans TaxID=41688 RepID=A0A2N3NG68_9PEZI|nr:hypothetical protein jhhlp_003187 [Lomentospora prolificans]